MSGAGEIGRRLPADDEVAWSDADAAGEMSRLFEFAFDADEGADRSGLRALVNSALVTQSRMPMLDAILDRAARLMTTSLRQLTDDNVEVSLDDVSTARFGEFIHSLPAPAVVGVVRAAPLDHYALLAADGTLVFAIVDLLLGGRRGGGLADIADRSFTAIELGLAQRVLSLLVEDLAEAFRPVADGAYTLERVETTPRFAAIAQEASVCAVGKFRVRFEDRSGRVALLLPHAALDPVRRLLTREFVGDSTAADVLWRDALSAEVAAASVEIAAVVAERVMSIGEVAALAAGETLVFSRTELQPIELRAGAAVIGAARIGRSGQSVAVRLEGPVRRPPGPTGE